MPYAAIKRANIAEEALRAYQIGLSQLRNEDGSLLDYFGGGDFTLEANDGNPPDLDRELLRLHASALGPLDALCWFEFSLPPEYVAGGDIKIGVTAKTLNMGTNPQVDVKAFQRNDDETRSGDLCTTEAPPIGTSYYEWPLTINASGLAAGDRLQVFINALGESGENDVLIAAIRVRLDVKG